MLGMYLKDLRCNGWVADKKDAKAFLESDAKLIAEGNVYYEVVPMKVAK